MPDIEKVLTMVAEGKISVEDGERLIKAIKEAKSSQNQTTDVVSYNNGSRDHKSMKGKLVIDIQSAKGEKVKLNLPLKLAKFASKMIPKERLKEVEREGYNIKEILNHIRSFDNIEDDIVNITSGNGDKVRIYIDRD